MGAVLTAWLAEVGIITLRSLKSEGTLAGLPIPSQYLATFALYGSLSLVKTGSNAAKFAGALAWGFTIATALNYFNPTNPLKSGKPASSSTAPAQTTGATP